MVSKSHAGSPFKNTSPAMRPEGAETKKPTLSLRNTQPPLLFNKKQSVLLGMNQAVKRPVYVKERNKTLTSNPPMQNFTNVDEIESNYPITDDRRPLLNSTTSPHPHQLLTSTYNDTQKSEVFPRDHSDEPLLMNVGDRVSDFTTPLPTTVNINENVSKENVTFNQENLDLDHVNVKELSENHESSFTPVSGRS